MDWSGVQFLLPEAGGPIFGEDGVFRPGTHDGTVAHGVIHSPCLHMVIGSAPVCKVGFNNASGGDATLMVKVASLPKTLSLSV